MRLVSAKKVPKVNVEIFLNIKIIPFAGVRMEVFLSFVVRIALYTKQRNLPWFIKFLAVGILQLCHGDIIVVYQEMVFYRAASLQLVETMVKLRF